VKAIQVALVILCLATVVALYNVATVALAPSQSTSSTTVLADAQDVQFNYLAKLSPNALNETQIGPGQGVIYLSLVQNLSVWYNFSLNVSPAATVHLAAGYELIVSAPGNWNYTYAYAFSNATAYTGVTAVTASRQAFIDLPAIEGFLRAVQNQTGVTLSSYIIYFEATLSVAVVSGTYSLASVTFPALGFGLTTTELTPGALSSSTGGSVNTTTTTPIHSRATDQFWSFVILLTVLAATALVAYLAWLDRQRGVDVRAQLRTLTAPYKDAIAVTWTAPKKENIVAIRDWEDLVHVADMLGRPILRYEHWKRDPARTLFYVLDGPVQYIYLVPIGGRRIEDDLADLT
jgi:hypothetical protein